MMRFKARNARRTRRRIREVRLNKEPQLLAQQDKPVYAISLRVLMETIIWLRVALMHHSAP